MTEAEVLDRVYEALVEALGVDPQELGEQTTLVGDLGADSVDLLDISYEIEKRTGCEINLEDLFGSVADGGARQIVSLRDLAAYIRESRA